MLTLVLGDRKFFRHASDVGQSSWWLDGTDLHRGRAEPGDPIALGDTAPQLRLAECKRELIIIKARRHPSIVDENVSVKTGHRSPRALDFATFSARDQPRQSGTFVSSIPGWDSGYFGAIASSVSAMVREITRLRNHLRFAGTTCHGAEGVEQRVSASSKALR